MIRTLVVGEVEVSLVDDPATANSITGTTWVDLAEPTPAEVSEVSDVFGIHGLAVEEIRNGLRPKTESFKAHTFVLVQSASLRRGDTTFQEELDDTDVGLFIGQD